MSVIKSIIIGLTSQTATNSNILDNSGNGLFIDVQQYNSGSVQVASTGTGGTYIFECSNNGNSWSTMPVVDDTATASSLIRGVITPTVSTRMFSFSCNRYAFIRLRIATTITGGSITSVSAVFSDAPFTGTIASIENATAANTAVSATQSGTWTLQMGNTPNTTPILVTPVPSAAQGASTDHILVSAASTNATLVKNSAGTLNSIIVTNVGVAAVFVKLFNKASAPTPGTDSPIIVFAVQPNTTFSPPIKDKRFSTGIGYALTSGIALLDTGIIVVNAVVININYT